MTKLLQINALFYYNVIQLMLMPENHMRLVGSHYVAVVELTLLLVSVELHQHICLWQYWDYRMQELELW